MIELFSVLTLTCSQVFSMIHRLKEVIGLTMSQKVEIVNILKQSVSESCSDVQNFKLK